MKDIVKKWPLSTWWFSRSPRVFNTPIHLLPCQNKRPHPHAAVQSDRTIEARMGKKRVAVATLLVHSVKMATRRQSTVAMAQGGMLCRGVIWLPIHLDRPDTWRKSKPAVSP